MKLDLRNRFLLPTCGALLIAFAAYLGVTVHKASAALESTVHEEMTSVNDLVQKQLTSWVEHRDLDTFTAGIVDPIEVGETGTKTRR